MAIPKIADWVAEATNTIGTGDIKLAGSLNGFSPFSIIGNGNVYYTIQEGFDKEIGIGSFDTATNVIKRTTVICTIVNNKYSTNGTPMVLKGYAEVFCTISSDLISKILNEINTVSENLSKLSETVSNIDLGNIDHNTLKNRSSADSHPSSAISHSNSLTVAQNIDKLINQGNVADDNEFAVQIRSGSSDEIAASTPAKAELLVNHEDNTLHIGTGSKKGGVKQIDVISIENFGAALDGVTDDTDVLQNALNSHKRVYIPPGKVLKITKPIVMLDCMLYVYGIIEQHHDGIGIHLVRGSHLVGGIGDVHIRRMSDTFNTDIATCILLWNNNSNGCIENKVYNIDIVNGKIDFTNPQGSVDPADVQGTGVWLLAGDIYGMATQEAWEHTYRNRFQNVRVDGFEFGFKLQAETLSYGTRNQNGWVNGNTFYSCSTRRCKRNIYVTCPMESKDGTDLEGECSGNFFTDFDIQFSTAQFIDAIYCNGRHNTFDVMLWDVKPEFYPVCVLTKRDTTKPYGYSEPSGNVVHIRGTQATEDNRGIFEISPGFNKIIRPRDTNDNILPVNPIGSGQREDQSYIGVVENYIGLQNNLSYVNFQKLNENESIVGSITPNNLPGMFDPEQESYGSVPVTADTYGVNIVVRFSTGNNHVQLAGLSLAYKEFVSGTVDFDFYDDNDNKIASVFSDLTRNSSISTGRQNITNVRWYRVKIRIPQDGSKVGNIDISNLFCKVYNKRNDWYHLRRDKDETIKGKYTFDDDALFNKPVKFGSGATSWNDVEILDKDKGFILKSSNGTRFKIKVDNAGALTAEQVI